MPPLTPYSAINCSSKYPNKGDQIAINCPADPPHPSGWYSAVVNNCTINGDSFTLEVEWDGGDLETLVDPEWRMLGEGECSFNCLSCHYLSLGWVV